MNSKQAFSDWLIQRASPRAAERLEAKAPQAVDPPIQPTSPEEPVVVEAPVLVNTPAEPPSISAFNAKFEPVVIDEFLWQSLFEDKSDPEPVPVVVAAASPDKSFEVVQTIEPERQPMTLPAGFQDVRRLEELLASRELFSGLVVAVGITQGDPQGNEELANSVSAYIRTLLRECDFACRTAADEYLLLCPNLNGAAAQRHLAVLSERLWDFQLRALGSFLMLFSLGGVDVQCELLSEAIASATERMAQTRRTRKSVVMLTPG